MPMSSLFMEFKSMRSVKLFAAISVAAAIGLCKPALAEEVKEAEPGFWQGFSLGGYTSASANLHPDGNLDGALNELSSFIRWEGNSRWRFFAEIEIERPLQWNKDEDLSSRNAYIDIERLYLDYNLSEKLNVRGGRFLTPAGRWNVMHAAPLVWTTSRPLVTSRLFPESVNGVMLYGAAPFNDKAFEYTFYVDTLQQDSRDKLAISYKDALGMRLALTGKINYGLSFLDISEDIPGSPRYRIFGLDFMTKRNGWEFSGEWMERFRTDGGDGGSGAYLQGVAPLGHDWYAVGRLESFQRPAEGSSERVVLGAAWRITPKQVFKVEMVGGDKERADSPKGLMTSFAILF